MERESDTYRTIVEQPEVVLYKDRQSKFYGYVFPIGNEFEVKPFIAQLRKKYPTANHVCFAWQLGTSPVRYRANDDGEPNNSAGMPIYGQLQSFQVTNVMVAVVRIFGGTKLGVGGLIHAYRNTAQMALEAATIVTKTLEEHFSVSFGYQQMDRVMRIIKQGQLKIVSQKMELECELVVSCRKKDAAKLSAAFEGIFGVQAVKKQQAKS